MGKKYILFPLLLLVSSCTQITLTPPVVEGNCENIVVTDDRAVDKDGLIHNDPIMGATIMEFSPSLAEAVQRNICQALESENLITDLEFSITDLQCSGNNGLIEGYLRANDNEEERIRVSADTSNSGVQIATICGFAVSNTLEVLGEEIAQTVSTSR